MYRILCTRKYCKYVWWQVCFETCIGIVHHVNFGNEKNCICKNGPLLKSEHDNFWVVLLFFFFFVCCWGCCCWTCKRISSRPALMMPIYSLKWPYKACCYHGYYPNIGCVARLICDLDACRHTVWFHLDAAMSSGAHRWRSHTDHAAALVTC